MDKYEATEVKKAAADLAEVLGVSPTLAADWIIALAIEEIERLRLEAEARPLPGQVP